MSNSKCKSQLYSHQNSSLNIPGYAVSCLSCSTDPLIVVILSLMYSTDSWISCKLLYWALDILSATPFTPGHLFSYSIGPWISCQLLYWPLDILSATLLNPGYIVSYSTDPWISCQLAATIRLRPLDILSAIQLTPGYLFSYSTKSWISCQLL